MSATNRLILFLLITVLSLSAYGTCVEIDHVPVTIREQGFYCLTRNLSLTKKDHHAISIMASNVVIDLQQHTLSGPIKPKDASYGIYGEKIHNIYIQNGHIHGFHYAILFGNRAKSHNKESNQTTSNISITEMTITNSTFRGIYLTSDYNLVVHNKIYSIGRTERYTDGFPMAIDIKGQFSKIRNNVIQNIFPAFSLEGVFISLSGNNTHSIVDSNTLAQIKPQGDARLWGIWYTQDPDMHDITISNNQISNINFAMPLLGGNIQSISFRNNKISNILCQKQKASGDFVYDYPSAACPDNYTNLIKKAACGDSVAQFYLAEKYSSIQNMRSYVWYLLAKRNHNLASEYGLKKLNIILNKKEKRMSLRALALWLKDKNRCLKAHDIPLELGCGNPTATPKIDPNYYTRQCNPDTGGRVNHA